jgi:limonene-1,2-epoxide hydrolase
LASAEDLANNFWSALCHHDVGRAVSLLAADAVFHPAGLPPARADEAVETFLVAAGEELTSHLETIAVYQGMVITERIGRVVGEPTGRPRSIVSLARVNDSRITSWQDFVAPLPGRAVADPPSWSGHWAPEAERASAT